jgi:hypothetical protein
MEFHDRRGEAGTGYGRLIEIEHVGLGHELRKSNRYRIQSIAKQAVNGHSLTPGFKGMTVADAERDLYLGHPNPIGGDELAREKRE